MKQNGEMQFTLNYRYDSNDYINIEKFHLLRWLYFLWYLGEKSIRILEFDFDDSLRLLISRSLAIFCPLFWNHRETDKSVSILETKEY